MQAQMAALSAQLAKMAGISSSASPSASPPPTEAQPGIAEVMAKLTLMEEERKQTNVDNESARSDLKKEMGDFTALMEGRLRLLEGSKTPWSGPGSGASTPVFSSASNMDDGRSAKFARPAAKGGTGSFPSLSEASTRSSFGSSIGGGMFKGPSPFARAGVVEPDGDFRIFINGFQSRVHKDLLVTTWEMIKKYHFVEGQACGKATIHGLSKGFAVSFATADQRHNFMTSCAADGVLPGGWKCPKKGDMKTLRAQWDKPVLLRALSRIMGGVWSSTKEMLVVGGKWSQGFNMGTKDGDLLITAGNQAIFTPITLMHSPTPNAEGKLVITAIATSAEDCGAYGLDQTKLKQVAIGLIKANGAVFAELG